MTPRTPAEMRLEANRIGGAVGAHLTKTADAAELRSRTSDELRALAASKERLAVEFDIAGQPPRYARVQREQARAIVKAAEPGGVDSTPTPISATEWRAETTRHLSEVGRTTDPDRQASARRRAQYAQEIGDMVQPNTPAAQRAAASRLRWHAVGLAPADPVGAEELVRQAEALESTADRREREGHETAKAVTATPKPDSDLVKAIKAGIAEALGSLRDTRSGAADVSARLDKIEKALAGSSAPVRRPTQRR